MKKETFEKEVDTLIERFEKASLFFKKNTDTNSQIYKEGFKRLTQLYNDVGNLFLRISMPQCHILEYKMERYKDII